ncbi:hypothetical protein [Moorena producens]|uniref:hypothetical protein n=1 Tax=Moorena producens TaxID=1155739 RepID=UPI003C782291
MRTDKQSRSRSVAYGLKCWFVSTKVLKKKDQENRAAAMPQVRPMANLIRLGQAHLSGLGEAAPPKGVPPMRDCRGFPHSRFASREGSPFLKPSAS